MSLPSRQPDSSTSTPPKMVTPFLVSLVAHLLILPVLYEAVKRSSKNDLSSASPVERVMRVKIPEMQRSLDMNGQVVDLPDSPASDSAAPDAKFLSDKNRRVARETQAKATGLQVPPSAPPRGAQNGSPGAAPEKNGGKGLDLSVPKEFLKQTAPAPRGAPQNSGENRKWMASLPPNNYLPEVLFGDETLLNTKEYAFAGFFVRMKRQIEGVWHPLQWIRHEDRRLSEIVSIVDITLKSDGYVKTARLVGSSGRRELDSEAVRAVEKGGPYLNPPQGLIAPDGLIHLGPIRFIVSLNERF